MPRALSDRHTAQFQLRGLAAGPKPAKLTPLDPEGRQDRLVNVA